jgi:hypothetical protein
MKISCQQIQNQYFDLSGHCLQYMQGNTIRSLSFYKAKEFNNKYSEYLESFNLKSVNQ